jgi:NitT/TauT family transport system permease protein
MFRKIEPILLPVLCAIFLIAAWHYGVLWSGTVVLPAPYKVWTGALELWNSGKLPSYIADSLIRVGSGYLLAVLVGVPVGLLVGWYRNLEIAVNPVIQLLRPISPLAWIPLAIIFFGIGNGATVFLIFLASFFPIVVAAATGVKTVPEMYIRAGRNFGLSTWGLFRRIVLPAALPSMLTGLRISFGVAWLVVVAAEMIAVNSGLGYLIIDSRNAGKRYDLVIAGMLIIGLLGLAIDILARRTERLRPVRWGFRNLGV